MCSRPRRTLRCLGVSLRERRDARWMVEMIPARAATSMSRRSAPDSARRMSHSSGSLCCAGEYACYDGFGTGCSDTASEDAARAGTTPTDHEQRAWRSLPGVATAWMTTTVGGTCACDMFCGSRVGTSETSPPRARAALSTNGDDGARQHAAPCAREADGIRFGFMEQAGKRFLAVRVEYGDTGSCSGIRCGWPDPTLGGRRFSAKPHPLATSRPVRCWATWST